MSIETLSMDGLDISILLPAFIAGLVVLLTHIPLGREVIHRGIIFIDLAIAQIAGLGVIIAFQFGGEMHGLEAQGAAIASALLGAWLIHGLEKRAGEHLEAMIGTCFVLAASASVLLLANNPHGSEHLKELLVGQILWVDWQQIVPAAIVSAVVVMVWFLFKQKIGKIGFYILFAIAITMSVQLIGVYLVFSSLIIPALATARLESSKLGVNGAMLVAAVIGISGYLLGLIASALLDLPSGAVIVWSLFVTALIIPVLVSRFVVMKS